MNRCVSKARTWQVLGRLEELALFWGVTERMVANVAIDRVAGRQRFAGWQWWLGIDRHENSSRRRSKTVRCMTFTYLCLRN